MIKKIRIFQCRVVGTYFFFTIRVNPWRCPEVNERYKIKPDTCTCFLELRLNHSFMVSLQGLYISMLLKRINLDGTLSGKEYITKMNK